MSKNNQNIPEGVESWKLRCLRVKQKLSRLPLIDHTIWQKKQSKLISSTIEILSKSAVLRSDWEKLRTPSAIEILSFDGTSRWEGVQDFYNEKAVSEGTPRQNKRCSNDEKEFLEKSSSPRKRRKSRNSGVERGEKNKMPSLCSSTAGNPIERVENEQSPSPRASSVSCISSSVDENKILPVSLVRFPKGKSQPKKKEKPQARSYPIMMLPPETSAEEQTKRFNRLDRFSASEEAAVDLQDEEGELANVGRSKSLEKPYLRITGIVNFSKVRPREVLEQSLKECMKKYQVTKRWNYLEEQFRSIRQDLTVQNIRDSFAIVVYETNAKVALENGDLSQFNQCQGQLEELYRFNGVPILESNRASFLSYRIVYLTLQNLHVDLLRLIGELDREELANEKVSVALRIRKSYVEGNFCRVFKLMKCTDEHSRLLMKVFLSKLRMMYLLTMAKGHFFLSLTLLENLLEFPDFDECKNFLLKQGACFTENNLDCRKSVGRFEESPLLLSGKIRAMLAPGAAPADLS